jgi:sporulation protein YlmC with PRC-barrel domain
MKLKPVAAAVASAMVIGFAAAPAVSAQSTADQGYRTDNPSSTQGATSQGAASQGSTAQRDRDTSTSTDRASGDTAQRDQSTSGSRSGSQDAATQPDRGSATSSDRSARDATARDAGSSATRSSAQSTAAPRDQATSAARGSAHGAQQTMADLRASKLMGMNVRNEQGKDLGEINDLVVDVSGNRIHYAVLGHGGVLGVGEKEIAVPLSRFSKSRDGRDLVLNMNERQLEDAPQLERSADWNDPRTWDNVGQYYHRTLGMPATAAGGQSTARFHRASDVIGMDVVDASNDEVGEIEDLVVNMKDGSIHYAVLEFDRAWNPDDKLVALPMSSFRPSSDRNDLVIGMKREQIANAPSFERRDWPDLADTGFRDRVMGMGRDDRTIGMDPKDRAAGAGSATASGTTGSTSAGAPAASGTRSTDDRSGASSTGSASGSGSTDRTERSGTSSSNSTSGSATTDRSGTSKTDDRSGTSKTDDRGATSSTGSSSGATTDRTDPSGASATGGASGSPSR